MCECLAGSVPLREESLSRPGELDRGATFEEPNAGVSWAPDQKPSPRRRGEQSPRYFWDLAAVPERAQRAARPRDLPRLAINRHHRCAAQPSRGEECYRKAPSRAF